MCNLAYQDKNILLGKKLISMSHVYFLKKAKSDEIFNLWEPLNFEEQKTLKEKIEEMKIVYIFLGYLLNDIYTRLQFNSKELHSFIYLFIFYF